MDQVRPPLRSERGTSMIEVLVTLVIVSIGLLALAGLQTRLQGAELESYQRAQALVLLKDMSSRIAANRKAAANYIPLGQAMSQVGTGMTCPNTGPASTRQELDTAHWCRSLQGAAESSGGSNVGAMVGGRGCVQALAANAFLVTVAWQGLGPISAPPAGVACGAGQYDGGTACVNDLCRRVVTTVVRIGAL